MAVVLGPLHSSEARGSVGSLVYNTRRGTSYVKARSTPKIEFSDLQIATRAIRHEIHIIWSALSDDQRRSWDDFAAQHEETHWTGKPSFLTGWNWFVRLNYRRLYCGEYYLEDPPPPPTSYIFTDPTWSLSDYDAFVYWTPASPAPDPHWHVILWAPDVHLVTQHPSFKFAKQKLHVAEQFGELFWTLADPGYYSLYLMPVSEDGYAMPPTRLIVNR
jgi:hypothetical protein